MIKLIYIIIILMLLLPVNTQATDKWTKEDKALEVLWFGLHFIDWGQTTYIAKNTPRYWEGMNPLLGKYPSVDTVNVWFISTFLLHLWIIDILPQEYRKILQGISIAVSGACVVHNKFSLGIKMDF